MIEIDTQGKIQVFQGEGFVSLRVYCRHSREWVVLRLSRSQRAKLANVLEAVSDAP